VFAPEPGNGVGDPVDVARRGVAEARAKQHDVLIVDTAGRLGVDAEMMQQAADIRSAVAPDEVLFVVDAMIGQDAVATANAFSEGVGITGVVLTKLDGDARGGAALSVASVTGKPVMFASTGEKLSDFEPFHPDRMASRILDMGDVLTLIEQAEQAFDKADAEDLATRFLEGEDFTLEDFLTQMQGLRKMGSLKKMLGMLPGMAEIREQLEQFDEREIDRIEAIVRSMTPEERRRPKVINGSRRARIARGSGVTVTDVNQLLDRFADAQKMMRQMRKGGGMPGMPGMPMPGMGGMPGLGGGKKARGRSAPKARTRKGKSGNPAKRAQQEQAAAQKAATSRGAAFGPGAFGGDGVGAGEDVDPASLELPPGFEKFLGR
jgi:signal recognition particle subunit SRP54